MVGTDEGTLLRREEAQNKTKKKNIGSLASRGLLRPTAKFLEKQECFNLLRLVLDGQTRQRRCFGTNA